MNYNDIVRYYEPDGVECLIAKETRIREVTDLFPAK